MTPNSDHLLSAYDYILPEHLIAHIPTEQRDQSKLLVYNKATQEIVHRQFSNISDYLKAGDLLVMNNTRVIPARIFGYKSHTGTAFEFLLLDELDNCRWLTMVKKSKRVKPGYIFEFPEGVKAEILTLPDEGQCEIQFRGIAEAEFMDWLQRIGEIPLPPYINNTTTDRERYQTVFNQVPGSVAAPTAGLHFTPQLIEQLKDQDINCTYITLQIGAGTFSPVRTEMITQHPMHSERFSLSEETAQLLNKQKAEGKRIIAVGTTATRVLESVYRAEGKFVAKAGQTNLFVYPGQELQSIDGLITNFHLPQSTLMMLVAAWIGREKLLELYELAIGKEYRFYSFGDSMFLLE